jgi:hypothetical protein
MCKMDQAPLPGNEAGLASLPGRGSPFAWVVGLLAVLVVGAVLRLIWVADIEYKFDEAWTFQQMQEFRRTGSLPALGMPSSQKALNPGLSLWVFAPLAALTDLRDPCDLARAVQIVNVLALLALTAFVLGVVPAGEREPWLWAVALVSVNPLAVLFHRKIWPPCVCPLLITAFLLCWWYRQRWWGALGWGLIGACLGQVHGAGFFFAGGFVLWAFLFDRRGVAWGSWFAGSCLGVLPMLPWLWYLAHGPEVSPQKGNRWTHLCEGKFWSRWVMEPLGFGLDYSLNRDFGDFLRYPLLGGQPTYLMLLLHVVAGATGLLILGTSLRRWWRDRAPVGEMFTGRSSPTALTQNAALWGYGIILTLSTLPIHRHYMILLFPLQFVWLARQALGPKGARLGRAALGVLVVCQALLSLQFLGYVHTRDSINGDYGRPYRAQQVAGTGPR